MTDMCALLPRCILLQIHVDRTRFIPVTVTSPSKWINKIKCHNVLWTDVTKMNFYQGDGMAKVWGGKGPQTYKLICET